MLKQFIAWTEKIKINNINNEFSVFIKESELSNNPSARIDIDTPTKIARITVWASGSYEAEIIDIETELTIFSDSGIAEENFNYSSQFAHFLEKLELN